jgi:hypothetical protein
MVAAAAAGTSSSKAVDSDDITKTDNADTDALAGIVDIPWHALTNLKVMYPGQGGDNVWTRPVNSIFFTESIL